MEIKEYIIKEADKLFCRYGFKSVTMDDIARHLGMSKKTIYQNFSDKNELVNLLIRERLDVQQCSSEDWMQEAENAVEEIWMSIAEMQKVLGNLNPMLFYDLQKYHPKAWQMLNEYKYQFIYNQIVKNLKRGLEEGLYRSDMNVEIIARMRMEQVNMVFNRNEQLMENNYSLSQVMQEISEHFLYGICNNKGLETLNRMRQHKN